MAGFYGDALTIRPKYFTTQLSDGFVYLIQDGVDVVITEGQGLHDLFIELVQGAATAVAVARECCQRSLGFR